MRCSPMVRCCPTDFREIIRIWHPTVDATCFSCELFPMTAGANLSGTTMCTCSRSGRGLGGRTSSLVIIQIGRFATSLRGGTMTGPRSGGAEACDAEGGSRSSATDPPGTSGTSNFGSLGVRARSCDSFGTSGGPTGASTSIRPGTSAGGTGASAGGSGGSGGSGFFGGAACAGLMEGDALTDRVLLSPSSSVDSTLDTASRIH
mmetsp:Transcript_46739/g.109408  ORF Transcript_46739/g.109408 Transcript_46739/m.109408 type:complete len:204 (-) Transcript_46739:661-1272(-)